MRAGSFLVASAFAFVNFYAVRQSVVSLVLPRRIANIEIGEEVPNRYLLLVTAALSAVIGVAAHDARRHVVHRAARTHRTSVRRIRSGVRRRSRLLRLLAALRVGALLLGDAPAARRHRRRDPPLRADAEPAMDAGRALRVRLRAPPLHDARRHAAPRPRLELSARHVSAARRGQRTGWSVHVAGSPRDGAGDARARADHAVRRRGRALGGMEWADAPRLLLRQRRAAAVARRAHRRAARCATFGRSGCDRQAGASLSGDSAQLHATRLRHRGADAGRNAGRRLPLDGGAERTDRRVGREHAAPVRRARARRGRRRHGRRLVRRLIGADCASSWSVERARRATVASSGAWAASTPRPPTSAVNPFELPRPVASATRP